MSTNRNQIDARWPASRTLARQAIERHNRRSFCDALDLLRLRYQACPELPVPSKISIEIENQTEYEAAKKAFPSGQETVFVDGQYRIWYVTVLGIQIGFQFMNLTEEFKAKGVTA